MVEKPIDWKALLKLTNNRPKLAKEFLKMFAVELPKLRHAINEAYKKSNLKEMKDQVHKLHGSCCYMGVTDLKKLSQQLEESLLDNRNSLEETLRQLNSEVDLILRSIQEEFYDQH